MAYGQYDVAFAGMKADVGNDHVESAAATGNILFGAVVTDTAGKAAAGGTGTGIAAHSHAVVNAGVDGYKAQDCVSVMVQGSIWARVKAGETVVAGAVKFDAATGELAATGNTLAHAVIRKVATVEGGTIAKVQLNHPRIA